MKKVAKSFLGEPQLVKRSFQAECDINQIIRKYARTGVLPVGVSNARYGDFSGVEDFFSAQLVVKRAEAQLASLPAKARARFKNDPGELLRFVADKKNKAEAQELGLLAAEVEAQEVAPKTKVAPRDDHRESKEDSGAPK